MKHSSLSTETFQATGGLELDRWTTTTIVAIPRWKRTLDLVLTLATTVLWVPVTILVAVFIRIVSRGPVLFRQERIGHRGQRFNCLKLRTMRINVQAAAHEHHLTDLMFGGKPMKKLDSLGDSRLVPGAWLIRALGLDELPQLINVLRGEMSLVGPRPCINYEYEAYTPRHRLRLQAIPGLTGLWQVSGKNNATFDEMIDLDIDYQRRCCLVLDIKIILITIPALCRQARELNRERKLATRRSIKSV